METTLKLKPDICPPDWQTEFKRHTTNLFVLLRSLSDKALHSPYELTDAECADLEAHYHLFLLYLAAWYHSFRQIHVTGDRPMTLHDVSLVTALFHGTDDDDGLLEYGVDELQQAALVSSDRHQRKQWRGKHLSISAAAHQLNHALAVMDQAATFAKICTNREALMFYLHGDFFDHTVVLSWLEAHPFMHDLLVRHLHDHCATMHRALPADRIDILYNRLADKDIHKRNALLLWWGDEAHWPAFVTLCTKAGCLTPVRNDASGNQTLIFRIPENQEGNFCACLMAHHADLRVNLKDFPFVESRGAIIYNKEFLRLVAATVICNTPSGIISDTVFSRAKADYPRVYGRISRQYGKAEAATSPASDIESAAGLRPLYLSLPSVPVSPSDICLQPPLCAVA